MTLEARAVRAAGVVGVSIEQHSARGWGGRALEFVALGTAIAPHGSRTAVSRPRAVVPVDAPAPRAAEIRVDVTPLRRPDH
jgi:hypothetical protein